MRNIRDTKYDDLAELRRMIKKTESNLREYSQSVSHSLCRSTIRRTK
jgi:light-regulated signal transduction histidine kinase (bacteriophytochrome)